MSGMTYAIFLVACIGLICAVILSVASKVMAVWVDQRIPKIRECLPGANCGACGYAGCDGYAKALVEDSDIPTNLCGPGGNETAAAVSKVLGKKAGEVIKMTAVVHCKGDCNSAHDKADYVGVENCSAAKLLFGGPKQCTYGCLGLGECVSVCPNDAICIENGIAHIDERRCIGCGLCAKACPNDVISIIKADSPVKILCNSSDKGAEVRKKCTAGCIGCGMCMKKCPEGAIVVKNNLAQIDYEKCSGCGTCKTICPVKCIL